MAAITGGKKIRAASPGPFPGYRRIAPIQIPVTKQIRINTRPGTVPPADLKQRERIKRKKMEALRLQHRKFAV